MLKRLRIEITRLTVLISSLLLKKFKLPFIQVFSLLKILIDLKMNSNLYVGFHIIKSNSEHISPYEIYACTVAMPKLITNLLNNHILQLPHHQLLFKIFLLLLQRYFLYK